MQVRVEIAQTPEQHQRGLSGRRVLAPDAGMAFLYASPVRRRFWMKFRGALEVNRGAFQRWGVRPGARVTIRR